LRFENKPTKNKHLSEVTDDLLNKLNRENGDQFNSFNRFNLFNEHMNILNKSIVLACPP
jgi:hypothetical protein